MNEIPDSIQQALNYLGLLGLPPVTCVAWVYRHVFRDRQKNFSPALALAWGYFDSFIGPLGRGIQTGKLDGRLFIRIARDRQGALNDYEESVNRAKACNGDLVMDTVATDRGPRTVVVKTVDNRRLFIDCPRTLQVLDPILDHALGHRATAAKPRARRERQELGTSGITYARSSAEPGWTNTSPFSTVRSLTSKRATDMLRRTARSRLRPFSMSRAGGAGCCAHTFR